VGEPFRVVHILVARQAAVDRLPDQVGEWELPVLARGSAMMPTTVQEPTRAIQRPRARVGETEGAMSRQRTLVPS
jgi:hypothetical protein